MINIESLWESAQKSVQFLSNPAPSKHRIVLQFYTESILKEVLSICKEGSKVQASPEEIAQTIRKTFKNIL